MVRHRALANEGEIQRRRQVIVGGTCGVLSYYRLRCRGAGCRRRACGPADATAIGDRLILDGCEVGGGGNDIHSVQSHYEPERDQIVVTLRLCSAARPKATYRVYLDHAAPFVGKAAASATCATTADSVVAHTPGGHQGVGTSRSRATRVRFVVPLAKLHVGKPKDVPLIPLWATSTLGKVDDRAPNSEAGDGCAHPRATTETLVQARVAVTGIAFLTTYSFDRRHRLSPGQDAIISADNYCQQEANAAGITNTDRHPRLAVQRAPAAPSSYIGPVFGPIQTADGTHGRGEHLRLRQLQPEREPVACRHRSTRTSTAIRLSGYRQLPSGPARSPTAPTAEASFPDCNGWTSNSASDTGDRWRHRSRPTRASRSEPRTAATRCID